MLEYFSGKTIATFLAHPDDETLGCGGTIARAIEEGAEVHCIIPVTRIKDKCLVAMEALGVKNVHWGTFEDNSMDIYPLLEVTKFLESKLDIIKPHTLITHHYRCCNQDHRVCYEASCIATRPIKRKINLLTCEVLSSTGYLRPNEFEPNFYVNLKPEHVGIKIEAMECYDSESRADRNNVIIECQAALRGAESGNEFAEGFIMVRGYE
jgi:LmbE family N-acetylglucosaminyl deacetylase